MRNISRDNAILSCGHGGQALGDSIYLAGNPQIGSVVYHRFNNNGYGDFEFISVAPPSSVSYTITNSIANMYSITGSVSNPPVNTVLKYYYYYNNTPSIGYGSVNAVGLTKTLSGKTIKGLTSVKVTYGSANPGDSGGLFFKK